MARKRQTGRNELQSVPLYTTQGEAERRTRAAPHPRGGNLNATGWMTTFCNVAQQNKNSSFFSAETWTHEVDWRFDGVFFVFFSVIMAHRNSTNAQKQTPLSHISEITLVSVTP